jgi:plastocyanin
MSWTRVLLPGRGFWPLAIALPVLWGVGLAEEGPYREGPVVDGGVIKGAVSLKGDPPGPYVIWVKKNADIFGEKLPDERLLVSKEGRVKNTVVHLVSVSQGKAWPKKDFTLLNEGGRFIPHVQVARRGGPLEIVNRDPVLHNVHALQGGKTLFNVALPLKGQKVRRLLPQVGIVDVMCDSHDWMSAWIVVLDHPYFAVTGDDGTYSIADVPPGSYRMAAWHEKLGTSEKEVTVAPGSRVEVNFIFSP